MQLRPVLQPRNPLQRRRVTADPFAGPAPSRLLGHTSGAQRFARFLPAACRTVLPPQRATGRWTRGPREGTRLPRVQHLASYCRHSGFHPVGSSLDVSSAQSPDTLGLWDAVRCAPGPHRGSRRNCW